MNAISPPSCPSCSHTHTSGRDMAWVHQGRMELVPNWQGTACFMCVIANANALSQEHWLFSQFFCWRTYMKNIKRLCGLLDPDHFQQQSHESTRGSLRQIILLHPYFEFSGRWKFNRNTIYLQAFPRWWFQQLHAEGSTLCGPAAQLAWPSFLSCLPYLKWEEKKTWSWENTAVWFQQKLEE